MNKQELMENYTMEQLIEIVTAYEEIKLCQEQNKECKTALPVEYLKVLVLNQEIKEKQAEIKELKSQLDRKKTEINQIDEILNELFGVTHDVVKTPDEFREILSSKKEYIQLEIEKYRCKAKRIPKGI